MPMPPFFSKLISAALLPPLNFLLVTLVGLVIARTHPRRGRAILFVALAMLWLCSTPYLARSGLRLLESSVNAVDVKAQSADAIVVLGSSTYRHAPEYGSDTVDEAELVRLRYAAKLQRETGKPVLIAGGKVDDSNLPTARQMKSVLEHEFRVPVRWTEDASTNTLENARFSFRVLHQAGIRRIYLVTHAWHMPRAVMAFESAGFEVVPAPTAFTTRRRVDLLSFLPSADALECSSILMHELLGLLWYRMILRA